MAPSIKLVDVGKRYRLGGTRRKYSTLRETIVDGARTVAGRMRSMSGSGDPSTREFWALRDVSFEVPRGSALGLIGRNGAGKSTLLKILARITEPTTGSVQLRGRVGSLLEVGTGFHSELTGRENVLLNGAILGMKRAEILRKFSSIVAFAEVERFIDTPVKHYSSGMYLRLAFAVAAHLEPDILLVDEVLAVGDADFQKRCLGKMGEVTQEGRTVIFVSHNLEAVRRLCSHAVLLDGGRVSAVGTSLDVIAQYESISHERPAPGSWIDVSAMSRGGSGEVRVAAVQYTGGAGSDGVPASKGPLEFLLDITADTDRSVGALAVFLVDQGGRKVINADTVLIDRVVQVRRGHTTVRLRIDALYVAPGIYSVGLWLADPIKAQSSHGPYDHIESAFEIEVTPATGATHLPSDAIVACDFHVDVETP